MVITQSKSQKNAAGGRYKSGSKKRKHEIGGLPVNTHLSDKNVMKKTRTKGGQTKSKLTYVKNINLFNKNTKKYEVVAIKAVIDNPANRHFVRRNIITKGTILETEKGKARITSRPGQDGVINAVIVE